MGQPEITEQKPRDSKIRSLRGVDDMVTRPVDPVGSIRPGTPVVKLGEIQSIQRKVSLVPLAPTDRIDAWFIHVIVNMVPKPRMSCESAKVSPPVCAERSVSCQAEIAIITRAAPARALNDAT